MIGDKLPEDDEFLLRFCPLLFRVRLDMPRLGKLVLFIIMLPELRLVLLFRDEVEANMGLWSLFDLLLLLLEVAWG